jgi:spore coat polysaccharide biosynthesis protein SpsF
MLAILQARMNSTRLPGKVMASVNNRPVIMWQIDRIRRSRLISDLVVATTKNACDDVLCDFLNRNGINFYRGDEKNVLSRFCRILESKPNEWVVRLTADCPLFMPKLCDKMIKFAIEVGDIDYLSNTLVPTFPDGCDIEIIKATAIFELENLAKTEDELEHVTFGIYARKKHFRCINYSNEIDLSRHRWTLDTEKDLDFVRAVYSNLKGKEKTFDFEDVIDLIHSGAVECNIDDGNLRNSSLKGKKLDL